MREPCNIPVFRNITNPTAIQYSLTFRTIKTNRQLNESMNLIVSLEGRSESIFTKNIFFKLSPFYKDQPINLYMKEATKIRCVVEKKIFYNFTWQRPTFVIVTDTEKQYTGIVFRYRSSLLYKAIRALSFYSKFETNRFV